MRTRWVSLSTDAAPVYAAWTPVVARIWRLLGYRSIVHIHPNQLGVPNWDRLFGQVVLRELHAADVRLVPATPQSPLSMPNVARCSRLFSAHRLPDIDDNDFILTADADMIPLEGSFFDRDEDLVVLRCLYQRWMMFKGETPEMSEDLLIPTVRRLHAQHGRIRFPMCYTGATAKIWREVIPPTMGAFLSGLTEDCFDADEHGLTHAILSSRRVAGPLEVVATGHWRKGELALIDPVDRPLLSIYQDMPRGLIILGDGWKPEKGPIPDGAIDFIPSRFTAEHPSDHPWWCFDVVRMRYPELDGWLTEYQRMLEGSGW